MTQLETPRHGLSSVGVQPVASGPLAHSALTHRAMLRVLQLSRMFSQGLELKFSKPLPRSRVFRRLTYTSLGWTEARMEVCPNMREFTQDLLHITRFWGASMALGQYFVESDEMWLALLLIQGMRVYHSPCTKGGASRKASCTVALVVTPKAGEDC